MEGSKRAHELERAPLSPLNQSVVSRPMSYRMDNGSDVSDLQQVSLFDFGESEFELMHVRVTVHALTGLLSERGRTKAHKVIASITPKAKKKDGPFKDSSSSISSSSSQHGTSSAMKTDKTPTFAIASFGRNVTSSQTSIKTHLPSLPLGIPTSSFGFVYRYMAQWQEPKPLFLQEDGEVDNQSSFTFLRVMMRESIGASEDCGANTAASKYVHETLNIEINLSRGKEIIPLGVATLAISGEEEGPQQMNLPAKAIVFKGTKAIVGNSLDVKKSKKMFKKKLKRAAFPSDPKRKFYLDENATLRVTVCITPQEAINDARARREAKKMMRQEIEELRKQKMMAKECGDENEAQYPLQGSTSRTKTMSESRTEITHQAQSNTTKTFGSLFCNAALCTSEDKNKGAGMCVAHKKSNDFSVDSSAFEQMIQEKYGYSLASSVLSSVSDSESESDYSDDGQDIHINRKIVVKKRHHGESRRTGVEHG